MQYTQKEQEKKFKVLIWALVTPRKQGKAGWGDKLKQEGVPYSLQETTWHQGSKAASRKPGMVKAKDVNQASLQTHGLHL